MANRRGLNLTVDLSALEDFGQDLGKMRKDLMQNLASGMRKFDKLAEEGSRKLAPYDSGDLASSIKAEPVQVRGTTVTGEVGSNLAYALRVHEEPGRKGRFPKYDAGVKEDDYYVDGLGRRTRERAAWRGQAPGRKYIERAVVVIEEDFDRIFAEALEKTLKGVRE